VNVGPAIAWHQIKLTTNTTNTTNTTMHLSSITKRKIKEGDPLSRRELQVIALLADGHTKQSISEQLRITRNTVATHVGHIFKKLDVSNAHGAVGKAFRCGILSLD
jgi:DNA-binding CsgD family transcriptional regulator